MALVNEVKKEIHAKIVYFGPGQSGKTTNLEYIYSKLKPEYRGKFKFMNTPSGRIVFFDFMRPELAGIGDFSVRFHIYTVPGDAADTALWKNVLKGTDGIVFVADLEPSRMLQNRRSLETLKEILAGYETALGESPCLFQCNKKDVDEAVPMEQIKSLLDISDFRTVSASARSGEGVLPTLSEMVKLVLQNLRELPLGAEVDAPVVSAEPEPAAVEQVEEMITLQVETEIEPVVDEVEPGEEPISLSTEPAEELVFAEAAAAESVSSEPAMEMGEVSGDERILPETIVDEPAAMLTEESFMPQTDTLGEAFPQLSQDVAAGSSDPEIEVAGAMEALGAGRFRLPLVIRMGDREVKTALSLDLSFEKPGRS